MRKLGDAKIWDYSYCYYVYIKSIVDTFNYNEIKNMKY